MANCRSANWCGAASYLNDLIEQDHRRIKQRLRPMSGLKSFLTADVVIGGIELAEKIKKGQYITRRTVRYRLISDAKSVAIGSTWSLIPSTPTMRTLPPSSTGALDTAAQYSPETKTVPAGASAVRAWAIWFTSA